MDDKLYIIIPAYNEEENIERVVEEWYPIVEKYGNDSKMVVVDDGSKDSTYTKLRRLAKDKHSLIPLSKQNGGHGSAILLGYRYALEGEADYIFQTDSDGQTSADDFAAFWEVRNEWDMIIGHRVHRQDGISRIVVTKTLKIVLRITLGVWITDANTPFRLMKKEALQKCLSVIPEEYNLPNVIITAALTKKGKKILYIPITFKARQGGINSINMKKITQIGIHAVRDFVMIRKNMEGIEI